MVDISVDNDIIQYNWFQLLAAGALAPFWRSVLKCVPNVPITFLPTGPTFGLILDKAALSIFIIDAIRCLRISYKCVLFVLRPFCGALVGAHLGSGLQVYFYRQRVTRLLLSNSGRRHPCPRLHTYGFVRFLLALSGLLYIIWISRHRHTFILS